MGRLSTFRKSALALIAASLGFASLTAIPATVVEAAVAPAVSGVMYRDINDNDVRDPGEPTLDGVSVALRDVTSGLIVSGPILTAADGSYVFESLPPGDYRVVIDAPQNYLVSDPGSDNAFTPTGDQTTGRTEVLTIGAADDLIADGLIAPRPQLSVGYFAVGADDGSNPFDTFGGCASPTDPQIDGEDCGSDNGVVRSGDPLNVSVSVTADNYEPGAPDLQNVIYEQTIVPGPGSDVEFDRIPAVCSLPTGGSNPLSSITNNPDGSITLLCNLGDISEGAALTFTTAIVPTSESENGSTFSVSQRVYSLDDNGIENAVPDDVAPAFPEYTISSRPSYDVNKVNFRQRNVRTYTINGESLTGYMSYFLFGISADRAIGVEQLVQPITITDSITAVGQDGVTPVPNFEYYIRQCIPNPTRWGDTVLGREGLSAATPIQNKVIDSGTCAFDRADPTDVDSPYELTLDGIDMSGDRYPTSTYGGTDLSAGPFYVAYYRVQIFVPFRTIDPSDGDPNNNVGAIQLSNELSGFDPDSPSGTSNYGDGFEPGYDGALMEDGTRSNNIVGPSTFELRVTGSWAKYIRGGINTAVGTSNPLASGQSSWHSGDGEIEPGQQYHSLIPFTNNGTVTLTDPQVCDTFDNATMRLANNSFDGGYAYVGRYSLVSGNDATWPDNYIVEYASVDYSPDSALDGTGDGVPDYNASTGRYDGNWSTQRATRCSDVPAGDWQLDPNDVPGGIDAVNIVRVRAVDPARGLEAGEQIRTVVPLEARENFFGGPNDGEFIPTGTVLANFGAVRSDQWGSGWTARNYRPSPETTNGDGDRLTLTRAQIRLEKHTLNPPTDVGETGSTLAGSQIVWELIPTASAANATAVVTGVTVTDVLPPELTYNPDCTIAQGGTPAGQVLFDTPGPGETTLVWNLGDIAVSDPIDPIVYCTDSDPLAPNGTSVTNDAVMDSTNTVSGITQRSDDHTIVLEQVGSIQVSKSVDLTLDDTDDEQLYTLGFGNYSANFQIGAPTIIDVLPYNGDGTVGNPNFRDPASDFSGTSELTGPPTVTWFDGSTPTAADPDPELGTFYYTVTDPSTISIDADTDTAANLTVWCTYDAATNTFTQASGPASSACPTAFTQVTAFKFVSNYDLEIDGDPRQGMFIETEIQALDNEPGDIYTNRFGLDSPSLPAAQFLRSNNVTVRVASYSIGDFVFVDADGDGAYDASIDVPVPDGAPIELRRADGTLVATTDTSVLENGRYLFDQLGGGDYLITIPASAFQAGGVLEGWVVTPIAGAEIDDENEAVDQHGITTGTEIADGITTGILTLSAIPPGPGEVPIGEEPIGENVAGIFDPTLDAFSNLTLDVGLIGPPAVDLLKEVCSTGSTCDPAAAAGAGGWVKSTVVEFNDDATYRMTVTNTGWQNLVDLSLSDPQVGDCDRTSATEPGLAVISPNQSVSWTCTQTNVTNDLLNTATVEGEGLLGDPVEDSDSAEVETPPSDPEIAVAKQVEGDDADTTPGVFVEVGSSVEFTFAVTNPGSVPLENVELVDDAGTAGDASDDITFTIADLISGDTDGDTRLDPGETWLFGPISDTIDAGQYTNWATVTGDPTNGEPEVTDSDPANVYGADGGIEIIKFVNGADADTAPGVYIPVGDAITWTYEVTNTGNIALDNVAVSDDSGTAVAGDDVNATFVSGDDNDDGLLDIDETWVFELSGTATSGPYVNVGTATGTAPGVSTPFEASNPANHVGFTPGIDIEKSTNTVDADDPTGPIIPVGDPVTWTYEVTNTGDIALSNVTVVDDNGTPANLADDVLLSTAAASGDSNGDGLLDVDETWLFTVTGVATAGQYGNLATVTGDAPPATNADGSTTPGEEVADADASHYLGSQPEIAIVKRVNNRDANFSPGISIATGAAQVWTYSVTNPGTVPLADVSVVDDAGTPTDPGDDFPASYVGGDTSGDNLLDPGETWTYTASGTQPEDGYTNLAEVTGTSPESTNPDGTTTPGVDVTDDDPASSFGVTGGINIVKTVNGQDADSAPGALVNAGEPVTWTYTVTNTGNVSLRDVTVVDDAGTPTDATDDVTLALADLVSGDDDGDDELDLVETWIFEVDGTADAGPYVNNADAIGTTPPTVAPDGTVTPGVDVTDDDPANSYGIDPGVNIVKTINGQDANSAPGVYVPTGDPVEWTFTVTNTGNIALADVTVVDDAGTPAAPGDDVTLTLTDLVSGDTNDDGLLDTDETWIFTIAGTQADEGYRNLGDVTGTAPPTVNDDGTTTPGVDVTDDDPANSFGIDPGIDVVKTVNGQDANTAPGPYIPVGDPVEWTFTVTNTGNIALADVTIVDDAGTPTDPTDDVTLTTADLISGDTNTDGLLDTDETWTFTITGTAVEGPYVNLGEATGTTPDTTNPDGTTTPGVDVTDDDPANHVGSAPGITVEKSTNTIDADDPTGPVIPVGDPVTWTYIVTNTGTVPLANVTVVDDAGTPATPGDDVTLTTADLISGDTNSNGLLDLTETWSFEITGTATSGQYGNLATVTGDAPDSTNPDGTTTTGIDVTDDDASHYLGSQPEIAIVKSINGDDANAAPGTLIPTGGAQVWTYTVTNPGTVALSDVEVIDDAGTPTDATDDFSAAYVGGDANGNNLLDPGEIWTYTASGTQPEDGYTNLAEVTGTSPESTNPDGTTTAGVDVTDDDPANSFGVTGGIDVVKTVNGEDANSTPGPYVPVGDPVEWTFTVTNTGNIALSDVTVVDDAGTPTNPTDDVTLTATDLASGDTNGDELLDTDETWIFTITGTAVEGPYVNVGEATGTTPDTTNPDGTSTPGVDVTDDDPANHFGVDAGITVVKTVNGQDANTAPGIFVPTGDPVEWTFTVTNTGNIALSDVTVVDDAGTPTDPTDDVTLTAADLVSGDANGDGLLDTDETWIFTIAGTQADEGYRNLGEVTGTAPDTTNPDGTTTPGVDVTDDDPANSYGIDPEITIVKTVNGQDANTAPGPYIPVGDPVEWTFTVTNTGNIALSDVTIVDDSGTPAAPGDDVTLTAADLVSGDANGDGLLDTDETWIFTITGTAVEGPYRNVGVATGTTPDTTNPDGTTTPGVDVTDDDPANHVGSTPGIAVEKSTNTVDADITPGVYIPTGGAVVWTYAVTNTGTVPLAAVEVIDDAGTPTDPSDDVTLTVADLVSGDTNSNGLLDLTETWNFELTGAAVAGPYTNEADASGTAPDTTNPDGSTTPGETTDAQDPSNYTGSTPEIAIEKLVNDEEADTSSDIVFIPVGELATWTFIVTNTGTVPISDVTVVDDLGTPTDPADDVTFTVADLVSGDTNGDDLLDLDETWTFTLTGAHVEGLFENTATATGDGPDTTNPDGTTTPGIEATDDDPAVSFGTEPSIGIQKSTNDEDADVEPGIYQPTGAPITWTYTVTNTGNIALNTVTVVDDAGTPADPTDDVTLTVADLVSGDTDDDSSLDTDETWVFEITGTATSGQYTNDEVVTGTSVPTTNPDGTTTPGVDVSDNDPSNHFGTEPSIAIVKTVNGADANDAPGIDIQSGGATLWEYSITNTGNIAVADVTIVDDLGTPADLTDDVTLTAADLVSGDTNGDELLDLDETWVFELTGTAAPGPYVNEAEATASSPDTTNPDGSTTPGVDVTDDDVAHHLGSDAGIELIKTVNGADADDAPGIFVPVDAPLTWTYTVTNPGTVVLSNVVLTDDSGTPTDPTDDVTFTAADIVSGDDDGDSILDLDETWLFELTGTATVGPYENIADVVATAPDTTAPDGTIIPGVDVTDDNPANHTGWTTGVDIIKTVNGPDFDDADANEAPGPLVPIGDEVSWTYTVTNSGSTWLTDVIVVDDQGVTVACPSTVLAPAGDVDGRDTMICTGGPEAVTAGQYTNIGSITGTPVVPDPSIDPVDFDPTDPTHTIPVTDPETGDPIPAPDAEDPANHYGTGPAIEIVKQICVDGTSCDIDNESHWADTAEVATGDRAEWRISVNNIGNIALSDIEVIDAQVPTCSRAIDAIAAGESVVYTCDEPLIDLHNEAFVNTATVTATDPTGETVDDEDDATLTSPGSFTLDKRLASASSSGSAAQVGDVIEFELVVTNDGMRTLTDLEVVDSPPEELVPVADSLGGGQVVNDTIVWTLADLAPGESVTLRYSVRVAAVGQLTNSAVVNSGTQVVADDDPTDNTDTAVLTATPRTGPIAFTGASTGRLLLLATLLMAGGFFILIPVRRRRSVES